MREQGAEENIWTKREGATRGWTNLQNERLYIPPNITDYTKMRWIGHAERAQKYTKAYKIVFINSEVKRPLRIPWSSWKR